jgi:hypothetical protein
MFKRNASGVSAVLSNMLQEKTMIASTLSVANAGFELRL